MSDVLPQRFRWVSAGYVRWKYGVLLWNPTHETWEIHTFGLHPLDIALRREDVESLLVGLIGAVSRFEWIDNDFAWKPIEKAGGP